MKNHPNPHVQEVIDKFHSIKILVDNFTKQQSFPTRGIIISGDAGIGKTHTIMEAIHSNIPKNNVVHIKGSSITSPMFYVRLWQTCLQGKILVIDDVDIVHKTRSEMVTMLDLMKGATEMTSGERILSWDRININSFMKEHDVPHQLNFQGSIVWITNDTFEEIHNRAGGHWKALRSRFSTYELRLELDTKMQYTNYLIDNGLLGNDCKAFKGGFSDETIQKTKDFIYDNWKDMEDCTPRNAIQIASIYHQFGDNNELSTNMIKSSQLSSTFSNTRLKKRF